MTIKQTKNRNAWPLRTSIHYTLQRKTKIRCMSPTEISNTKLPRVIYSLNDIFIARERRDYTFLHTHTDTLFMTLIITTIHFTHTHTSTAAHDTRLVFIFFLFLRVILEDYCALLMSELEELRLCLLSCSCVVAVLALNFPLGINTLLYLSI